MEARLCAIISGKMQFRKTMKKGKETQIVTTYPTCSNVISAIDVLLKLRGVYKAPIPLINEDTEMRIIVDNEEERKLVEKILNDKPQQRLREAKNTNEEM